MSATLEHTAPGAYRLTGSVLLTEGLGGIPLTPLELREGVATVDVGGVEAADSLLLALLLEWDRLARTQGGSLRLVEASARLRALLRVTGLTSLFFG
ncbi:MAG: STAS domain-containing protein [Gammaproteobacteria bacterium]|nr:STAS domain-containing protein [Gammaproteobacteria bacterium]